MEKISVIIPIYNMQDYLNDCLNSVIASSYKNIEILCVNDCSTDKSIDILQEYQKKDERIRIITHEQNKGLGGARNSGIEAATGEYIVFVDSDDVISDNMIEELYDYINQTQADLVFCDIMLLDDRSLKPYKPVHDLKYVRDKILEPQKNFAPFVNIWPSAWNKIWKKSIIEYIRFPENIYYEDHLFYYKYLFKCNKVAYLDKPLYFYRHERTNSIMKEVSPRIFEIFEIIKNLEVLFKNHFNKEEYEAYIIKITIRLLWERTLAFTEGSEIVIKFIKEAQNKLNQYDEEKKLKYKDSFISIATEMLYNPAKVYNQSEKLITKKYLVKKITNPILRFYKTQNIDIFSASDDNYAQHLCVAITSILINSKLGEQFNFYILDGGISKNNKKKIVKLKHIKNFKIEFIKIDNSKFDKCKMTSACNHISKQTYYRYIIPKLKPNLKKCFYFDVDIVVTDSLSEFWNVELGNNYVAVVEELYQLSINDRNRLNIENFFNAGIILINNKLWVKDNISDKLFANNQLLEEKLLWQDQDVLNFTFDKREIFVSPKYNVQQNCFYTGKSEHYTDEEIFYARMNPVIIHYNGPTKPWQNSCLHPLAYEYNKYLKISKWKDKNNLKFIQKIFSIRNENNHKVVTLFGIKMKFEI